MIQSMKEIVINLENSHRGKENIEIKWNISVEPKNFKYKFLKRHQHIEKTVFLSINNVKVDTSIVCDKNKLFTIEYANNLYQIAEDESIKIPLVVEETSFLLSIDKDVITDCKEQQQLDIKGYPITFEITLRDEDGNLIDTKRQELDVRFQSLNIQPQVKLDINIEADPINTPMQIQYNSQLNEIKIGDVVAWIEQEWEYTPDVNLTVDLKAFAEGKKIQEQVYFKINDERVTKTSIMLKHSRKNVKKLPVYMDFSHISNPVNDKQSITVTYKSSYTMAYSPDVVQPMNEQMREFFLLKDQQGTELQVILTDNQGVELGSLESNRPVNIGPVRFVPMSRMTPQVEIDLRNIATDNSIAQAGLIIKDLTVTDDLRNYKLRDKDDQPLLSITTIDSETDDDCDRMRSSTGLFIANGSDAHSLLYLTFNPSRIASVLEAGPNCEFQVETTVSFNYLENKDGKPADHNDFHKFTLPVVWHLQLLPYPQWLCVDYGSSAIVCKYDEIILDLNTQKDAVFKEAYREKDRTWLEYNYEKGTPFLSSDALFQTVSNENLSALCTEQAERHPYDTLAVCLSPTSNLVTQYQGSQLPCMKILVGNIFLPESREYNTFQYPCLGADGTIGRVTAGRSKDNPKSLLRVSSVFEETYSTLFRYFIAPAIEKNIEGEMSMKKLNKLVLTHPNTYTPVHLRTLRNIVSKAFPYLREGYLEFVSESDAVAAYYVSKWDEFNPKQDIFTEERVLVYDMGAGTLDITLFDKFVNNSVQLEVDIKGKIGTGKAGNYLDFIIAQIISLKCENMIPVYVVSTELPPDATARRFRQRLKDIVKMLVKPNLTTGNEFVFSLGGSTITITADEIINHKLFKKFLHDVGEGILNQMQAYMNEDNLHINTVIMSGRSCSMMVLRDAVKHALGENLHYVYLDSNASKASVSVKKRVEIPLDEDVSPNKNPIDKLMKEKDKQTEVDRQKTVVVDGAVAKVSRYNQAESEVVIKSRRLYASYGLIYQALGGRYKYKELLNHADIPYITDSRNTFDSINVTVNGTANSEKIKLVQTYLSAKETEEAYNQKNLEFISEMEEHDMDNFGKANQLNVRLRLDKNNNISLFVNGTPSLGSAPQGIDLTSYITKQSIWPVTF